MTNEERDLITRFVARVGGGHSGSFAAGTGQAGTPPLPPVDQEADALIADLFVRYPEARYRMTQTAFVQEHALTELQNRVQRLEWELQQARQQAQAAPAASPWGPPPQQESRGFFGGLFGGGSRQAAPPPQYAQPQYAPPPPQYAPGYSPGMFQQRGSGFLGSALTTAAGVAGGLVAGNALMGLFSGSHGGEAGLASTASNEFIPVPPSSPWATPPAATPVSDPYDAGGADKGSADTSGWQQPVSDPGGWDTQQSVDNSGWSDGGGDGGGGDWV
jgi:hypothetical protein